MNKRAYTLTEIATTITILGLVAAFAIPNYTKAVDKEVARNIITQARVFSLGQKNYNAAYGNYYAANCTDCNVTRINDDLRINMTLAKDGTVQTDILATSTSFECQIHYKPDTTTTKFAIEVTDSAEPCCYSGTCPSGLVNGC